MRPFAVALALAAAAVGVGLVASNGPAAAPAPRAGAVLKETIGHSVGGRALVARRVGSRSAKLKIVVIGEIHGNELAGRAVTRRLRKAHPPRGVELWLIDDLNPDGAAAGTRQNRRGVDLNRNFPHDWKLMGKRGDTYYGGPRPLSEPESSALAALVKRIRPRVTLTYHQHMKLITRDGKGGDSRLQRLYAKRSGLPSKNLAPLHGTDTGWQNTTYPRDTAFVVELPAGKLSKTGATRHIRAVLAVAKAIAPPRVRQRHIPFGAKRKHETAAYAKRHYGLDDFHLVKPKVIVEHYTVNDSFSATFNTFAPDHPDPELHELPNVCSHYVVDKDGAVYQLVSTRIICRHTVGLNYTAIGIEHVGSSDGEVLGDRKQLTSSLRLTRMLQGRYRIATKNVIGHNESLSSPYYKENVKKLRGQTHGDFRKRSMNRYRKKLAKLLAPASLR